MIVDDEVIIATQLEERLTSLGYDIVGMASTGSEAIEMARELLPDLILMDIVMPGKFDGIAAAKQIQEEFNIPFIFITAYTDRDLIERAKNIEPLGYILKPFQDEQITASIEIALYNNIIAAKLKESEDRYRNLVEIIPHGIVEIDTEFRISFANRALHFITEYPHGELVGKLISDLFSTERSFDRIQKDQQRLLSGEPMPSQWIRKMRTHNERVIDVQVDWNYKRATDGGVIGFIAVITDITERLKAESALQRAHDELEERVEQRTRELIKANAHLKKEIFERMRAEEELRIKRANLEEVNTALKVLLKKRDENKVELEEKVFMNMKELAIPYLNKLRQTELDTLQEAFVGILESNLNDIISPFSKRLSSRYWNFTPTELRIANLIRQGKTTKEISAMLNLSNKTIDTHRKNIRRKLGIDGKKANLRSHLLSIQ
jgi:PAS domain S-box-containing protein